MLKNLQTELQAFGKYVVQQSRSNLTKQKHNVTKDLYNSIHYKLEEKNGNFDLAFIMDEYGTFLDKGVKGADPSLVKNGKQKGGNSPYSFKSKRPPMQPLADWAKKRNIRLRDRDKKGRFGSYKTMGFILAHSIKKKGIKPSMFFTKPFQKAFEKLPQELIEAYSVGLEKQIQVNIDKK